MPNEDAALSRNVQRYSANAGVIDRLLQGLGAMLCSSLAAADAARGDRRVLGAIVEAEALRYHEGAALSGRRAIAAHGWTVRIEAPAIVADDARAGRASMIRDDSAAPPSQPAPIRVRLIAQRSTIPTPTPGSRDPDDSRDPDRANDRAPLSGASIGTAAPAPDTPDMPVTPRLDLPALSPCGQQGWLSIIGIDERDADLAAALAPLAERVGRWLWRYQCAWGWSRRHGQPRAIVGNGRAIQGLERCVAIAAQSDLPAHVIGLRGSPTDLIAHAIHDSSHRWQGPLIETDVQTLMSSSMRLRSTLARAVHGSIILRHPTSGPPGDLALVVERLIDWLPPTLPPSAAPRLILIDDRERVQPEFEHALAHATAPLGGLLAVDVPSLPQRAEDLPELLAHLFERYQIHLDRLADDATPVLERALAAPGDQLAFERLIARLAMLDPSAPLDAAAIAPLLERSTLAASSSRAAPLHPHLGTGGAGGRDAPSGTRSGSTIEPKPGTPLPARSDWAGTPGAYWSGAGSDDTGAWPPERQAHEDPLAADMLDGRMDGSIHEAVRRAIAWAVANHPNDISTPDAAHAACVSSSHLAHLLKAELGTSFRLLLARLRIERARRLLVEKPTRSITDIALDVGFGDLSHFIKSFNRFTGATPREYRRRMLAYEQWRSRHRPIHR